MAPREAVKIADDYVRELFRSERATNFGLEELRFDDGKWLVTIGFSREWEGPQGISRYAYDRPVMPRTFKTVEIDDASKKVISLKHWPIAA
jgi:hypothetical protein